jgi:hypothetical protein
MTAVDNSSRQFGGKISEVINVAEVYFDYIGFILKVIESILTVDTPQKHITDVQHDTFSTDDATHNNPGMVSSDALHLADTAPETTSSFVRTFSDTLATIDMLAKQSNIKWSEVMNLMADILRNANAVISDIVFQTGDMTLDDFVALAAPAGYEQFRDFISGDLQYQKALVKIILEAGITTGRPMIDEWKLTVDAEDIPDRGTASVAAATTRVYFNRSYYQVPEVSVTVKGGIGEVPTPRIVEVTRTYFDVELVDKTGALVAGTISWASLGC